ncbi:MAG: GNAT family N-acetyltransferase [Candidatus Palauibacterales bacterium]|nr:GNAT family N-acetyltransferase [Candidatus Palauibacterales bacterium]
MDTSPEIREAGIGDLETIVRFNREMARETEGRELDASTLRAGVNALLSDPARGRYYLAEEDGRVLGQLLVTTEWSDWRNGEIWWIQSVYVAPDHRRRGVYSALHRHVRERARSLGAVGLRLYVDRENREARRSYEELGMERARYAMYEEIWGENA